MALVAKALKAETAKLASPDELQYIFGFRKGSLGPLGLRCKNTTILVDSELSDPAAIVNLGAGAVGFEFGIRVGDLLSRVPCALWANVTKSKT